MLLLEVLCWGRVGWLADRRRWGETRVGEVETHRRCSFEGCLCFDIGGAREEWNRISREGKRSGRRLDGCLCCCFSSRPHSLSSRAQTRRFSPHVNQIFSVLRHSGVSGMLFYDCFSEFEITMKWKAFSRWESLHAIPILSNHTYTDGILGGLGARDSRVSFERVGQMGFDLFIRSEPSTRRPDKARFVKNEPQYVSWEGTIMHNIRLFKGLAG